MRGLVPVLVAVTLSVVAPVVPTSTFMKSSGPTGVTVMSTAACATPAAPIQTPGSSSSPRQLFDTIRAPRERGQAPPTTARRGAYNDGLVAESQHRSGPPASSRGPHHSG